MAAPPPTAIDERVDRELDEELVVAFAPLHKRCLGIAVGLVDAALVAGVTLLHMLRSPDEPYPLVLLEQFFIGYEVSFLGAAIGAAWGFWVGFVLGWFFAFARNLVLALASLFFRARAELAQSRGFLDQI